MKIDEVTRSVILNNLKWITEEMGEYLARAAFSTNIKIRRDCSCALYTAKGDMLAQGTFVPVHLGIMSQTLKALLEKHPAETLQEGDALIHNDPYMYGSHLFDVMVFKPIFHEGKLFAFTGALAHQLDMGGSPRAFINETIHEEGLIIPGVFLAKQGVVQEDTIVCIIRCRRGSAYSRREKWKLTSQLYPDSAFSCAAGGIQCTGAALVRPVPAIGLRLIYLFVRGAGAFTPGLDQPYSIGRGAESAVWAGALCRYPTAGSY